MERDRPTEIHGCNLAADHQNIFVRQAHEALIAHVHRLPGTAPPAECAGQHTILQVQYPLVVQQCADVQLHGLVPDARGEGQPVGGVR